MTKPLEAYEGRKPPEYDANTCKAVLDEIMPFITQAAKKQYDINVEKARSGSAPYTLYDGAAPREGVHAVAIDPVSAAQMAGVLGYRTVHEAYYSFWDLPVVRQLQKEWAEEKENKWVLPKDMEKLGHLSRREMRESQTTSFELEKVLQAARGWPYDIKLEEIETRMTTALIDDERSEWSLLKRGALARFLHGFHTLLSDPQAKVVFRGPCEPEYSQLIRSWEAEDIHRYYLIWWAHDQLGEVPLMDDDWADPAIFFRPGKDKEDPEEDFGWMNVIHDIPELVSQSRQAYQQALATNDDSFAAPIGSEMEALGRLSIEMCPPMPPEQVRQVLVFLRERLHGMQYVAQGRGGRNARRWLGRDASIEVVELWMNDYTASIYNAVHLAGGEGVLRDRAVAKMAFDPKAAGFFDLVFGSFTERVFELRDKGLRSFGVYQAMVAAKAHVVPYQKPMDKLCILAGGSPKTTWLLHEIFLYVLPAGERLVVFAKESLHIWLLQTMMSLLGLEHATVLPGDDIAAPAFNDPQSTLQVLICSTEAEVLARAHRVVVLDVVPLPDFFKAASCAQGQERPIIKLVVIDGTADITRLARALEEFKKDTEVDVGELMGCREYVASKEPWDAVTREHEMIYRIGQGGAIALNALATWAAKVKGGRLRKLKLPRGQFMLRLLVNRYEGKMSPGEVTKVVLACAERIGKVEDVIKAYEDVDGLLAAAVEWYEAHPGEEYVYPEECVVKE